MTADEWLGLVAWLSERGVRLTADVAVRYGSALQRHSADKVRQALGRVLERQRPFTLEAIIGELRQTSSKYAPILAQRHRDLFPSGCPNKECDLCR